MIREAQWRWILSAILAVIFIVVTIWLGPVEAAITVLGIFLTYWGFGIGSKHAAEVGAYKQEWLERRRGGSRPKDPNESAPDSET
jgi:hypothetical protein